MSDRLPSPHAEHDLLLIAAALERDPDDHDRAAAERQIASCPDCAGLAADLRSIALATAALPAAARSRDFTLRPADAARLRPRGWRRLAAALGPARLDALRPLGAGLATLGLAGLLLATLPAIQLPMGAATSAPGGAGVGPLGAAQAAASAAPSAAALAPAQVPAASSKAGAPVPAAASPAASFGSFDSSRASAEASHVYGRDTAGGEPTATPAAAGSDDQVRIAAPGPSLATNDQAPPTATPGGVDLGLAAVSAASLLLGVSLILLRRFATGRARAG